LSVSRCGCCLTRLLCPATLWAYFNRFLGPGRALAALCALLDLACTSASPPFLLPVRSRLIDIFFFCKICKPVDLSLRVPCCQIPLLGAPLPGACSDPSLPSVVVATGSLVRFPYLSHNGAAGATIQISRTVSYAPLCRPRRFVRSCCPYLLWIGIGLVILCLLRAMGKMRPLK